MVVHVIFARITGDVEIILLSVYFLLVGVLLNPRITRTTLPALLEIHQASKNPVLHRGAERNNFHHQQQRGNTSRQASTTGRRVPLHQNSDREC
jgi:hypothetical protein